MELGGCPTWVPLPALHHTSCVTLSKPRSLSQPVCTVRPEADTSSSPHPANPLLPLSPRAADKAGRWKLRVAEQDPACSGQVGSCCQFHWAALPHSGEQRALIIILKPEGSRTPCSGPFEAAVPLSQFCFRVLSKPHCSFLLPHG